MMINRERGKKFPGFSSKRRSISQPVINKMQRSPRQREMTTNRQDMESQEDGLRVNNMALA